MTGENDPFSFPLFRDILKLNLGIAQADNHKAMDLIGTLVPLRTKTFRSRSEHNGWLVPDRWSVRKAQIKKDGKLRFDGTAHPLAVAQMSQSFHGRLAKADLDGHVYYNQDVPNAHVYHCRYQYRPWETHWGFCIPWSEYSTWPDGEYEVELETTFEVGELVVGEVNHRGASHESVLFQAHTCHPTQANDNIVGIMVLSALFRWLNTRQTRYSYRALFAPEHLGTVFYVRDLPKEELAGIKLGLFVEAVGGERPFALQHSFYGDHIHDRFIKTTLRHNHPGFRSGSFGTILGNDEAVWEAPGVEVPMISLSRFPFREYHTSEDTLDHFGPDNLDETLRILKSFVEMLEDDVTIHRKFDGLIALSNPRYNLYKEHPDPSFSKNLTDLDLRFARMQDSLMRHFNGEFSAFDIAEKFDIPFGLLRAYLGEFEHKGLVELTPVPSIDFYEPRLTHRAGLAHLGTR